MKILLFFVWVLCLVTPMSMVAQNKILDKVIKKELQTKIKEYNNENWKLLGDSLSLKVVLLNHYEKLLAENGREIAGIASGFKSKDVGHQIATNNVYNLYALQAEYNLKGRVVSEYGSDIETNQEFDHFYAAYGRLLEKEIKREIQESYSIIRDNGDGTFEIQTLFVADESTTQKTRIRALENAAKESAIAQKYVEKFADFVRLGD